ncbi:unnamed protein product [Mytilus edulis]|uniref:CCHC-type domain-containing protein n=1 Tax=Mytilus edulis TaxID=6550 RepID=A0A8S3UPI7_MYTED|nr:unnamed protein product [Mytilus edulis]
MASMTAKENNSTSNLVISKLTEARSLLDTPDVSLSKVVAAKDRISEGIDLIQERQKLIKLSDSSELRWRVVQEYITNSIADDSEEEKRMNRAQSSFERKSKAEKAKKGPRPVRFPYNKDRTSDGKNSTYKPGRCFTCGNRGHWSDNCPQNKKTKISTLSLLSLNNDLLSSIIKLNNVPFEHTVTSLPSVSITSKNKNVTTGQLSSETVLYLPGTLVGRLKIRTENNNADYLSRVMDHDDWGIESSIYHYLCNLWGICTVDRFDTHYNSQCERFNSKVWCPGTEAVDAFTQFWGIRLRQNVRAAVGASGVSKDHILYDLTGKMSSFLLDSRSNNTNKTYFSSFNRWSTLIKELCFNNLTADPIHVALYITNLIDKNCSPNIINGAIYSSKWVQLDSFAGPTDNSFVK